MGWFQIEFPKNLYTNVSGLNFLTDNFNKINDEQLNLILDFTKSKWIDANLSSMLSLFVDRVLYKNKEVKIIHNDDNEVINLLRKNGFFKRYDLEIEKDTYSTTIPLRVFNINQEEDFMHHLIEEVLPKINFRNTIDEEVMKSFQTSLSELFINVGQHAAGDRVYTCGQVHPKKEKVSFTIVNLGRTISDNVNSFSGEKVADSEAIDWAIKKGNTTKRDVGGLGLSIVKNFTKNNKGNLHIKSGKGILSNNEGVNRYKDYASYFPGTIVSIESNLKRPISNNL